MPDIIDVIHEAEYCRAAPWLESWFGEGRLRSALREELNDSIEGARFLARDETAAAVANGDRFVLDLDDDRFTVALYQAGDDEERDGDTKHGSQSNIVLLHHSFAIDDEATATWLRRELSATFAELPIRQIRFFQYSNQPPSLQNCFINDHVVAGLMPTIAATSLPETLNEVCLTTPDSMEFYDAYCAWYHAFWEQRPELKSLVRIEPREDMEECFHDGGVRWIMFNDEICGMIAAERSRQFGLGGWHLREKVIAPTHWGRGLSVAANILLARELPSQRHDAMWGTIDPGNTASLRSAQRVGRDVVANTYRLVQSA